MTRDDETEEDLCNRLRAAEANLNALIDLARRRGIRTHVDVSDERTYRDPYPQPVLRVRLFRPL